MDQRLTGLLREHFPTILSDLDKPITKSCMGWGIECGDGWFELLFDLMYDLTLISEEKGVRIVASQIKEKFGGLRFYYYVEENNSYALNKLLPITRNISNKIRYTVFKLGHGNNYNKLRSLLKKVYKYTYEKIEDIVAQAEQDSYTICEKCGKPGKLRTDVWLCTLCDNCNSN